MQLIYFIFSSFWIYLGVLVMVVFITGFILKYQRTRLKATILKQLGYRKTTKPPAQPVNKATDTQKKPKKQ